MNRHKGFTLIELLVAISILALVAVLGWRGLDGIVRARAKLTAQMDTTRGMQLAFAQMQSDGEHLVDPRVVGGRSMLAADAQRLVLVRTVFAEDQPTRLQVVAYRIENGTLTRRESLATRDLAQLDVLWQSAVSNADTTAPVVLQQGVNAMAVRLFENGIWRPAPVPAPPQQAQVQVPGMVAPPGGSTGAPAGLEVALHVMGQETAMTKVFLLGGV